MTTQDIPASLRSLLDMSGRVALVTGGSRGLGFQIASALGEFGATPVLVARHADQLEEAAARLRASDVAADTVVSDMRDPAFAEDLLDTVLKRHGRIDILVNNAGTSWGASAETHSIDAWEKVMHLNVTSLFRLTQAVAREHFIKAGKGAVINMASLEGLQGHLPDRSIGTVAYNTSKGAVINMTRTLAGEWGQYGIRVNAIAPGYFPSAMTHKLLEVSGENILREIPLKKLGNDHDLKGVALLLASDAGGHITGQTILVDGGASVV